MSSPGAPSSAPSRRQKRMGPAPFASFEDLSDELDSPEDKNTSGSVVRLPGIREDVTPCSPMPQSQIKSEFVYTGISLIGAPSTPTVGSIPIMAVTPSQTGARLSLTPNAPRIDISRASSSSHHDSKDSSPEREEAGNEKITLGFREEGTVELRTSTEELDFQEQQKKVRTVSPTLHEDSYHSHNRKDSQSSEVGLLCISGRTSRLSSIGSQGSAQSRISNASHLSVISGQSGASRSPSPHKMLLETSFCGTKPQKNGTAAEKDEGTKDDIEKVLLKRKHDPTKALMAEGITVETPKQPVLPEKPARRQEKIVQKPKPEAPTIRVDKPTNDILTPKLPKHIISQSGTEYIYIPLKGPMPEDPPGTSNGTIIKQKVRETKSASLTPKPTAKETTKQKSKSASPSPITTRHLTGEEPKYIRIKLKPDHMYDEKSKPELQKPDSLDLTESPRKPAQTFEQIMSYRTESPQLISPIPSPRRSKHLKEPPITSKSPSPSLSRKSSFASIFKSRETISPESPTTSHRRKNTLTGIMKEAGESIKERRRSRSKSRDRTSLAPSSTESIDSKGRQKSVFSLFKTKKRDSDTASPDLPNLEGLVNVEFKFNDAPKRAKPLKYHETPLDGDSVRIPLHSPTYYEQKHLLQEFKSSSQDSQDTVIEVVAKVSEVKPELSNTTTVQNHRDYSSRQSSTSSENLVFSTRLGSNNELFTTKLPKDKLLKKNDEVTTVIVEATSTQRDLIREEEIKEEGSKLTTPEAEGSITTPIDEILVAKTKILHRMEEKPVKPVMVSIEQKLTPTKAEVKRVVSGEIKRRLSTGPTTPTKTEVIEVKRAISEVKQPSPTKTEVKEVKRRESFKRKEVIDMEKPKLLEMNGIKPRSEEKIEPLPIKDIKEIKDDDSRCSSESEKDSEVDKKEFPIDQTDNEPERKGLVLQQDSFEDELPYIPTTLPQERSMAVPIVPIKQRSTFEMKTCPIERPRSTTPIHPTCLEDYCEEVKSAKNVEKLKISLPKDEEKPKSRSPRRTGSGNWFDFSKIAALQQEAEPPPPPLPPKGIQKEWINFEEIPERRKPPKRIQTIPSRSNIEVPETVLQENVIYTYVNPEDCKCECHERSNQPPPAEEEEEGVVREDELPLLEDDPNEEEKVAPPVERMKLDVTILDRRSIVSDSSVDLSTTVDHPDANGIDHSLRTPFTSDLGISSNRSSIISQEDAQSPDTDSPNAFPKAT